MSVCVCFVGSLLKYWKRLQYVAICFFVLLFPSDVCYPLVLSYINVFFSFLFRLVVSPQPHTGNGLYDVRSAIVVVILLLLVRLRSTTSSFYRMNTELLRLISVRPAAIIICDHDTADTFSSIRAAAAAVCCRRDDGGRLSVGSLAGTGPSEAVVRLNRRQGSNESGLVTNQLVAHNTHEPRKLYSRSNPPMYFIVISQWPHTADTIGYSFLPFRPRNATPKYWPSTMKLIVPSSMSSATINLSGTRNASSGFRIAGYVTPGWLFASWYNLFRPRSQPQLWSLLPTRLW